MRAGIIGHRSWLAPPLTRLLDEMGVKTDSLWKSFVPHYDFSTLDVVFLIAGRARPTDEERTNELQLVSDVVSHPRPPKKLIYVSSLAVEREPTPYAQTKLACEHLVLSRDFGYVVRPPVIFGEGQDVESDMLVPSIARSIADKKPLILKQPLKPFYMMHVTDVAHGLVRMMHGVNGKILNLRSNPVTPLDIIRMAVPGPGIPFNVLEGWDSNYTVPWPWPKDDVVDFCWDVSALDIRQTVNSHVKTIYANRTVP